MNENLKELQEKFEKIKNMGLVKSLRKGTTGIGYTFESLIDKKEDQDTKPDFKGIEIKCKSWNSKYDLGLFTLTPKRDDELAFNYIFSKYSYHLHNNDNLYRLFSRKVYSYTDYELYSYSFKLFVDYKEEKLFLQSFKRNVFVENVCYWNFDDLKNRLYEKLSYLAIAKGLKYVIYGDDYYRYFYLKFYKLKNFESFLYLINIGKIHVDIYMREDVNKLGDYSINNHGFSFKINELSIEKLFEKISI